MPTSCWTGARAAARALHRRRFRGAGGAGRAARSRRRCSARWPPRGALPFTREQFEDAIRRGGVGVKASLKAFAAGFDARAARRARMPAAGARPAAARSGRAWPRWRERIAARVSGRGPRRRCATASLRLADYQDVAYAGAIPRSAGAAARRGRRAAGRDRAPPGTVDELRGRDPRGRPEDAAHAASSGWPAKCGSAEASCCTSTNSCTRASRRSPTSCRPGWAAGCWHTRWARALRRAASRARAGWCAPARLRGYLLLYASPRCGRCARARCASPAEQQRIGQWLAADQRLATDAARAGAGSGARAAPGQGLRRHPCARLAQLPAPDGRAAAAGSRRRTARSACASLAQAALADDSGQALERMLASA